MSAEQDEVDRGFLETVAHALRMNEKRVLLDKQIREAMAVAGSMAGEFGCNLSDPVLLVDAVLAVRAHELPGRGALTGGIPNHWVNRIAKWKVGSAHVIAREEARLWPGRNLPCCYVLADAAGEIIYIGKTTNLRSRIQAHASKPWATASVMLCRDEADALRLEGDLIYQHQPTLNYADRRNRRFVRVAP